jgi:hypothetical protein
MAMLQRRRCVDPPNQTVNRLDLNYEVSDLQNWLDHTIHLFGEPVPFGWNALVLGLQTAICFERLQLVNPLAKPLRRLDQAIAFEGCGVHCPARDDRVIDQRV